MADDVVQFLMFFLALAGTAGILVGMVVLGLELKFDTMPRKRAALLGFGGAAALFVAVAIFLATSEPTRGSMGSTSSSRSESNADHRFGWLDRLPVRTGSVCGEVG
jgi:NAD/NADP transhydrogenase beta subunit